jgi:hypothetical protein
MGAWGCEPMDDDHAAEWLVNEVQVPLLATIKRTLQTYLNQTEQRDTKHTEAIAAAALLADLTRGQARMKYVDLDCGWMAEEHCPWSLACTAIKKIMQDEPWISGWSDPQKKLSVLERLLAELQQCQEANARDLPQAVRVKEVGPSEP